MTDEKMVAIPLDALLQHQAANQDDEIDLLALAKWLWGYKFLILSLTIGMGILAFAYASTLPKQYKAEVVFQPIESSSNSGLNSALLQSGLGSLLGLSGSGKTTLLDQMSGVLKSRSLALKIMKTHPDILKLLPSWSAKEKGEFVDANDFAEELLKCVTVAKSTKDFPRLDVELPSATMAATIANSYITLAQEYINQNTFTTAKKSRMYVEEQAQKFEKELTRAEEELKNFQEKHKLVSLESQVAGDLKIISELKANLITKEMNKEILLKVSTPNNPQMKSLNDEIAIMRQQLDRFEAGNEEHIAKVKSTSSLSDIQLVSGSMASAPQLMLDFSRHKRNVEIAQKVHSLLIQQLAVARITEQNEATTFTIIDPAIIPKKKSKPRRSIYAISGCIAGLFISFLILSVNNIRDRFHQNSITTKKETSSE